MTETRSKIHFPDENIKGKGDLLTTSAGKSSRVVLRASTLEDLEKARAALRKAMPINVEIDLSTRASLDIIRHEIRSQYDVDIIAKDNRLCMKTRQESVDVLAAAVGFVAAKVGLNSDDLLLSMTFDLTASVMPLVRGGARLNLRRIQSASGVIFEEKLDSFVIKGSLCNLIRAWEMIQGSLPLEVNLSLKAADHLKDHLKDFFDECDCIVMDLDAKTSVVSISSYERNVGNVYKVCLRLLRAKKSFSVDVPISWLAPEDPVYKYRHTHKIVELTKEQQATQNHIVPRQDTVKPARRPQGPAGLFLTLEMHQMDAIIPIFQRHKIDFEVFKTMNEKDFSDIGIGCLAARRKLMLIVSAVNGE